MIAEFDKNETTRLSRYNEVRTILWRVLLANLLVTLIKIGVGVFSGIMAIVADGIHSVVDATSNLIGLAAIRLARKPADEKHPYGYQRYETLGAFLIGIFMLLAAWGIMIKAIENFREENQAEVNFVSLGLMGFTFLVNLAVVAIEKRAGNRLKSAVLLADARHTQTDLYITASVVLSMLGMMQGWYWLDTVVAVVVVALIIKAAGRILLDASRLLTDESMIDIEQIAGIAYSVPQVRFVHNIRSRGLLDSVFIDLHVKMDAEMSISESHAVASEVERRLIHELEGVKEALVHFEPSKIERPTRWESISYDLKNLAEGMGLGIHDLYIHSGEENEEFIVELHLEFGDDVTLGKAHDIAGKFEAAVLQRWSQIAEVITHLEPLSQRMLQMDDRSDPGVEAKIVAILDGLLHTDQLRSLQLFHSGGHLHAVIVICLDENTTLTSIHEYSENIEIALRKQVPELNRVTLHVEPFRNKHDV